MVALIRGGHRCEQAGIARAMTAASCVHKAVHYLAHDHRPFAPARLAGRDQRRDDSYPSDVTDEEWELIVPATPNPLRGRQVRH